MKNGELNKMNFVKLRAFAIQRKDIRRNLQDDHGRQFYKHCLKIMESTNKNRINHWSGELWDLCEWVQDLKDKANFSITKEFIKDNYFCWGEVFQGFKMSLLNVRYRNGKDEKEDGTEQQKYDAYWRFADKVAEELANRALSETKLRSYVQQYLVNI